MRRFFYLTLSGLLLAASSAQAQNYHSEGARRKPVPIQGSNSSRNAVTTRPSDSPFSNPIFQPLPPAVSVDPAQNSNRSTVPLQTGR
jgi:hypothetical protein